MLMAGYKLALLDTFRVRASTSARVTAVEVGSSATQPRYPSPRPLRRGVTVQLAETRGHRDRDHHARTAILLSTRSSHGALSYRGATLERSEAEALVERRSFETCQAAAEQNRKNPKKGQYICSLVSPPVSRFEE